MNQSVRLAFIQRCVDEGKYVISTHVFTKHLAKENFTAQQGIEALLTGEIIEEYSSRDSVLISGTVPGLQRDARFITSYIHLVVRVEWQSNTQVIIITMYRPLMSEWVDGFKRRRS